MLTLTENATLIVKDIAGQPGLPESAGLRITSESVDSPAFAVTAADEAQPGDQIVQQDGATVYLDAESATMLDDKVLDASVDPEGRVEFALGLRA